MNCTPFQFVQRWLDILKGERGRWEGTSSWSSQGSEKWPKVSQCQCGEASSDGSWDSTLPHRLGDQRPILPDDSISKACFSDPRERHSWVVGDTHTSQRDKGRIQDCKPFLVNALGKGGQGPILRYWLEQTVNSLGSVELSQAGTLMGARVFLAVWPC